MGRERFRKQCLSSLSKRLKSLDYGEKLFTEANELFILVEKDECLKAEAKYIWSGN